MVFGTFDNLHPGHLDFFRQAAQLGKLFVVIARDTNVQKIKKRPPSENEKARLIKVALQKKVFRATLGSSNNFFATIEKNQPDIIALGFDQKTFTIETLKQELKKISLTPQIIRLKPHKPEKFKSSLLR